MRTIEWAAEQPWSNGVVAMAGMSYCGYVQVLAARERPDALRAGCPPSARWTCATDWIYDGRRVPAGVRPGADGGQPRPRRSPDRRPGAVLAAYDDWDANAPATASARSPELARHGAGAAYREWLERRTTPPGGRPAAAAAPAPTTRRCW